MKTNQIQKEKMEAILEDMRSYITYIPNRELDILAFMEQYQKADSEHRPAVLNCLRDCMDGKQYPNPYEQIYRYTADDVAEFERIVNGCLQKLSVAQGEQISIADCVQEAVCKLDTLNERCGHMLLDTWRMERMWSIINAAIEQAGMIPESDHALQHRMG